jgi:hypothetical protein
MPYRRTGVRLPAGAGKFSFTRFRGKTLFTVTRNTTPLPLLVSIGYIRRWEDNIKMDLREVGWEGADWIDLAQDRDRWRTFVYTVMNLRIP